MKIKLLEYEDTPRWYSLFWDFDTSSLRIKIHTFFLEHAEFKNWEPHFTRVGEKFDYEPLFETYQPNLGKEYFGINDSIKLVHSDKEWLTYQVKLPQVKQFTGMVCPKCDGTGKRYPEDIGVDEDCMYCRGTKKESILIFREIHRVCFSLQVLLDALFLNQLKTDIPTSEFQLFTISSLSNVGLHGHSVGGRMSPKAVLFLETFSDSYEKTVHISEIEQVMHQAHKQIYGEVRDYDAYSFRCYTRGGQIVFTCPGNACEIHTDVNRKPLSGLGNEIVCHNLDSSIQQLTLLSGLATLSALFDKQNT